MPEASLATEQNLYSNSNKLLIPRFFFLRVYKNKIECSVDLFHWRPALLTDDKSNYGFYTTWCNMHPSSPSLTSIDQSPHYSYYFMPTYVYKYIWGKYSYVPTYIYCIICIHQRCCWTCIKADVISLRKLRIYFHCSLCLTWINRSSFQNYEIFSESDIYSDFLHTFLILFSLLQNTCRP